MKATPAPRPATLLAIGVLLLPAPLRAQQVIEPEPVEPEPVAPNPVNPPAPARTPAADPAEPGAELWQLAMTHYQREDWVNAYSRLAAYLERFPDGPNAAAASFRLAEAARRFGDTDRARTHYQDTIRAYASTEYAAAASFQLGVMYYLAGNHDAAVQHFRDAAGSSRPEVVIEANFLLGASQEQLGNTLAAIQAYEALLAAQAEGAAAPAHAVDAHLSLARLLRADLDALAEAPLPDPAEAGNDRGEPGPAAPAEGDPPAAPVLTAAEREAAVAARRAAIIAHLDAVLDPALAATPAQRANARTQRGLTKLQGEDFEGAIADFQAVLDAPEADPTDRANAQFGLIDAAFGQERWDEVIRAYRQGAFPDDPALAARMHLLAGNTFLQLQRNDEALQAFNAALQADPAGPSGSEAGYRALLVYLQAKDANLPLIARNYIESQTQVADSPWPDRARLVVGEALLANQDSAGAAQWYGEIRDANHLYAAHRAGYLYKLGWLQLRQGDFGASFNTLNRFIESYPEDARLAQARVMLATSALELGNREAAETGLKAVIEHYPQSPAAESAWQQLGNYYDEIGDSQQAIEAFQGLLAAFPETPSASDAHYKIGRAHQQLQQYAEAIDSFRTCAELDPAREMLALSQIIPCYLLLRDVEGLASAVDRALELDPRMVEAIAQMPWLGVRFYQQKEYDRAVRYLLRVDQASLNEQQRRVLSLTLARALRHVGRYEEAVTAYTTHLRLVDNPSARALALAERGQAELRLERFDEARRDAEEGQGLVQEGRTNAELALLRGDIALGQQQWQAAAQAFVAPAQVYDDPEITPRALHGLVESYRGLGDQTRVAEYQADLAERYPNWEPETLPAPVEPPAEGALLPAPGRDFVPAGEADAGQEGDAHEDTAGDAASQHPDAAAVDPEEAGPEGAGAAASGATAEGEMTGEDELAEPVEAIEAIEAAPVE